MRYLLLPALYWVRVVVASHKKFGNSFSILFASFWLTYDIIRGGSVLWLPPRSPFALSFLLSLPTVCQTVLPLSLLTGFATSHRMIYALITSAFKCRAMKSSHCKNNFCGGVGKSTRHHTEQAKGPPQQRVGLRAASLPVLTHPQRDAVVGGWLEDSLPQPGLVSPSW